MIKILQLDSYSGIGGGQRIALSIVKRLKNSFDFIIVSPAGPFVENYSRLGIRIEKIDSKSLSGKIKEIRKYIKKETPDIVHAHGTRAALWVRLAVIGFKNKPKIIYTLHGFHICLLYTSPSPRDVEESRMPSSA